MNRQMWRRVNAVFAVLILIISYALPVAAAAETISAANTDKLTLLSAQTKLDDSGGRYLELKAKVSNQSQESAVQDITVAGNQLAEVPAPLEKEGVSWAVGNGTISLTIPPTTQKEVELHFSVDGTQWVEGQGMKLIAGDQELIVDETQTIDSTGPIPESGTGTTEAEATAETETQDEIKDEETEDTEEDGTYNPFIEPRFFNSRTARQEHTLIKPGYTTDETGKYPTASWQPTGQENVINHQGNINGSNQWDGVTKWDGEPTNRTNSYIEYGGTGDKADFAIRKYARQTTTPGLFDVYLNVKGNYQKAVKPMDIVLVVDWSGSMNGDRIKEVKKGVNSFVDTLSASGENITDNIRLGYIGYSYDDGSNDSIQLSNFNQGLAKRIKGFTPETVQGGTFTQKALRDAGNMLSGSGDREKIIVLLTDGVPTFSYHVSEAGVIAREGETLQGSEYYANAYEYRRIDKGYDTSRLDGGNVGSWLFPVYRTDEYRVNKTGGGDQALIKDTFPATIGEAIKLKNNNVQIHGLGIQLSADYVDKSLYLTKAQVEARMKQIVTKDIDGHHYYESAEEAADIADYLTKKAIGFSGTVADGSITDPIAEPFSLASPVTPKPFGNGTILPTVTEENGTIKVTNINLVKGQEIQLHYQVRLKTEGADFRPDYWYQMNGLTTFQPKPSEPKYEFGVPSGKAPGVKLNLKKVWDEFDGDRSGRPDQVTFEVGREHTTDDNSWKSGYVRIDKPANDTTDNWERTGIEKLSADGVNYDETLYLPKYNNNGVDFNYKVVNEVEVDGYTSEITSTVVTNTKKFKPYGLTIKKKSSASNGWLKGAVFKLTGDGLDVTLTDNGDGTYTLPADVTLDKGQTYTLTETQAPDGHELSGTTTWTIVVAKNGKVTIDDKPATIANQQIELTITNAFKKVPVAVWKYRLDTGDKQTPLAGATFELQKKNAKGTYEKVSEGTSKADGLVTFDSIEPGDYQVIETKGPKGYDTRSDNYEFIVDAYGKITYGGTNVKADEEVWTFTHANKLKPFDLTVNKLDDDKKALKGAKFKLTGPGLGEGVELPADGAELDTFHFKDLQPGTYELTEIFTPEGYRGLEKPVSITIHEDGSVTIDDKKSDDFLVEGAGNNQVELDVTNYAKIKLPDTGGNGRLLIYLSGATTLIVAAGYLLFRFSRQKEVG